MEAGPVHSFEEIVNETRYREMLSWTAKAGSARVGVSTMSWEPGSVKNLTAKYSALVLYHNAPTIAHEINGEKRPTRRFTPGDLMLRPPEIEHATHYESRADITVFALETELVQSATTAFGADVGEVFGRLGVRPFRSPLIEGVARQLATAARDGADRLYADALTNMMIHELWRLASGTVDARETSPGALPQSVLRQIDDAVTVAPGGQIALDRLADIAGMTMTAFTKAMKDTTGQTPYQFVLTRRVSLARNLIETTPLTLSEIAFRCGFSSQSHMTDVFRAKLGVSPGKLRSGSH
ncbi:MAG: helix-turn-helix transcriptional regulator [Pseudomonadota bacterium]